MGVFSGCVIALELGTNVPFKQKKQLRQSITANDGVVSFIINKKVKVVCTTIILFLNCE